MRTRDGIRVNLDQLKKRFESWSTFERYWSKPCFVAHDERKIPYIGDCKLLNPPRLASTTDPSTWRDAYNVLAAIECDQTGTLVGIGFVLHGDGTVCIDLDGVVDENGNITPEAQQILDRFPNTFAEYSKSGRGIHIWLRTSKPLPENGKRKGFVEIYQDKRYIAITMNILPNRPQHMEDYTDELHALYHELFSDDDDYETIQLSEEELRSLANTEPGEPDEDDEKLIARFLRKPENEIVWRGDKLPHHPSQSEADLSLAIRLLWYTNGDVHRTHRLFWRSKRVLREKLRNRPELITRAINKAYQLYQQNKAELEQRKLSAQATSPDEWDITKLYPCEDAVDTYDYGAKVCGTALRHEIVYIREHEIWFVYNKETGLWEHNKELVYEKVKSVLVEHYKQLAKNNLISAKELERILKRISNGEGVRKVIEQMPQLLYLHKEMKMFNANPLLIPLQNGVYDLTIEPDKVDPDSLRRKFRPYRPDDYITHTFAANYNPDAPGDQWIKALNEWCWDPEKDAPDRELIEYLWYAIGYTFTGRIDEQIMFVVIGPGGNGKSTLVSTIAKIMGNHATTMLQNLFVLDRYTSAEPARQIEPMRNKRMVVHPELPAEAQLDCEKIKRIVSCEALLGRRLYHEHELIEPTWKIWCTTNEMAEITDQAAWRRIRIIPFRKVFVPNIKTLSPVGQQDPQLRDKLWEQRDYLATQACHYAALWMLYGMPTCPTVEQATQEIYRVADPFEDWFNNCVEIDRDGVVPNNEAYEHYKLYVESLDQSPLSTKKWAQRMSQKQVPVVRTVFNGLRTRCRKGIKLLPLIIE
jgi:putative DNA primase/helicase